MTSPLSWIESTPVYGGPVAWAELHLEEIGLRIYIRRSPESSLSQVKFVVRVGNLTVDNLTDFIVAKGVGIGLALSLLRSSIDQLEEFSQPKPRH